MDTDDGSVDYLYGATMSFCECLHDEISDASRPPADKAVVAGLVWPKALWQIAPWCAGAQYPENAIEDTSVVDPQHASGLVRQKRSDGSPLKVRLVHIS